MEALSQLFNLNIDNAKEIISLCDNNDYPVLDFIKKYNIRLNQVDVSNVFLTCKHVTTANDKLESIKKYGLLSLADALTYETLLSVFLQKDNINSKW